MRASISLTFRGQGFPDFLAAVAALATTRACRTCDYGDSELCGHEKRAVRVCAAPVGNSDCAILPCLGSCSNPPADQARTDSNRYPSSTDGRS